jgi:hypothetical protein
MLLLKKIFYIVLLSFLWGCTSVSYITIDILQPAAQPALYKTADVALVNKVFNPAKEQCGHYYLFENQRRYDTTCLQQTLSKTMMDGIKYIIDDSQFFTNTTNVISTESSNAELEPNRENATCVLTQLSMKDETYFVPSVYGGYGVMMAIFSVKISLYYADIQEKKEEMTITDTVYWTSNEMSHYEFGMIEYERQSILPYLAFEAGKKIASHYFPIWKNVNRCLLSTSNKISLQATESAISGSWERADYFWEALAKEKNRRTASAALFNRAVYYEINGDFERALEYVKLADAIYTRKIHQEYLRALQARIVFQRQLESLIDK